MVEAVIKFLITICVVVACVFLVLWVVAQLGIIIPAMVVKIIWIIVALLVILFLIRLLRPYWGNYIP